MRGADLIVTATSSLEPVINKDWISAGAHINAIGTHSPNSREIDSATMAAARIFVDRRESALNESGDYLLAAKEGVVTPESIVGEIGELLIGTKSGRTSADRDHALQISRSRDRRRRLRRLSVSAKPCPECWTQVNL